MPLIHKSFKTLSVVQDKPKNLISKIKLQNFLLAHFRPNYYYKFVQSC